MKKRVVIAHNWSGKPEDNWYPWLKAELEKRGFEVQVPVMSEHEDPVIEEWVGKLADAVGKCDEQTYFVGHSIGCQTIMRYVASQDDKIGGCMFIAGWFKTENLEDEETEDIARPWQETPIDFNRVLAATTKFTVFLSSNDPYDAVQENEQLFKEKLDADVTILPNKGHFTAEDGVTELPEVLDAVLQQAGEA